MNKKTKKRMLFTFVALISLLLFFYIQNNSIVTTDLTIHSDQVPNGFDQYKIVHLSDLHNKSFGHNQIKLIQKVNKVKPDIILFTGDLIDSNRYDEKPSLILMEQLVDIAPVYYVTGNHEWWSGNFHSLEGKLVDAGVSVLRNGAEVITIAGDEIQLIGIDDPAVGRESNAERRITEEAISDSIKDLGESGFKILLSHRPEHLSLYSHYGMDVVFSGHAHGGQVRIPLVGGLVAPNQGLFPTYTSGKHTLDRTRMIVSRGLGNSIIPLRILNRPEIVVVTLTARNN